MTLPRRQRETVWLYATGLSLREVGEMLGISPASAKTHYIRARKALDAVVSADGHTCDTA